MTNTTPFNCHCCTKFSREADDTLILTDVIPLAPEEEWDLPWDVQKLAADTGSKDLDNFFVLKHVFLFLPFDLYTILSVASTCRSWRILSDRLPHWKYLLPLRNEVMPIASHMKWHHPPQWEREYFRVQDDNNALHYRFVKASGSAANKYIWGPIGQCTSAAKQCAIKAICCGDSSCDCGSSCCSSCSCSSSDDDRELQEMENEKRRQFLLKNNLRRALLELRQEDDDELAQRAFAPHRKVVDWMKRLQHDYQKRRAKRGAGNERNVEHGNNENTEPAYGTDASGGMEKEESLTLLPTYNDKNSNNNSSAKPKQLRTYGIANNNSDNNNPLNRRSRRRQNNNYGDNDDDDDDTHSVSDLDDDDNTQTYPIFDNYDSIEGYLSSPPSPQKQDQQGRRSARNNNSNQSPSARVNDDDGDDEDSSSSDSNDAFNNNNPSSSNLPSPSGGMQSAVSLDPHRVQEATIKRITAAQMMTYTQRKQYSSEQQQHPIRYAHKTLYENREEIMAGLRYRQEWMFGSLSSFTQFCREAKRRFDIEGRIGCREFYGPTINIQIVCSLALATAIGIACLYGYSIDKTVSKEYSDSTILNVMSLICCLALIVPVGIGSMIYCQVKYEESFRDPSVLRTASFIAATCILITFCVPLSLVSFREKSAELLLAGGNVSVCNAIPKIPLSSSSSLFKSTSYNSKTGQCPLPQKYLPQKLMDSTFLYFPPGTKILYHPFPSTTRIFNKTNNKTEVENKGSFSKVVPYSAKYHSTENNNSSDDEENLYFCELIENQEINVTKDAGFNNTQQISDRSFVGYYTIFLPPSCENKEDYVQNFTVVILGAFPNCPFWSEDNDLKMIDVWWLNLTDFPIPRTDLVGENANLNSVLDNATAEVALSHAENISSNLRNAVANSQVEPSCMNASNAMVTVKGTHEDSTTNDTVFIHDFFLRVSNGPTPHWTSSYYLERPSSHQEAASKTWQHESLDYSFNGLPILVADADIFLAHVGKLESKTKDEESSDIAENNKPTMIPPFNGDWDDNQMSPFWTAAHPAGLRKMQDSFRQGFIGLLSFILITYAVCIYFSVYSRGFSRMSFMFITGIISFLFTLFPLGFLILSVICWMAAPEFDAGELTLPVSCLATKKSDMTPFFIYSCVIFGLVTVCFIGFCIYLCYDDGECCCDSSCDCCSCCSCSCCCSCCGCSSSGCFCDCVDNVCECIGDCCRGECCDCHD